MHSLRQFFTHAVRASLHGLTLATLSLILLACEPKTVRPVAAVEPVRAVDSTGAMRYRIDGAASDVHILVYRGGAMARLGHNHVISSKEITGTLLLHNDLSRSQLEVTLPVNSLIVDDASTRASEGEEFSTTVPDDAREGTLRNLLKPEVLDGEHFKAITLRSTAISGNRDTPSMILRVTIKDVARDVVVVAVVHEEGSKLVAEGEFAIQQSDFGITPFSVGLGALQVQDRLRIKFKLVAVRES